MRTIVHIASPAPFGGLERVVAGLCNGLVDRGERTVLVLTVGPNGTTPNWACELEKRGLMVRTVRVSNRSYLLEQRLVLNLLRPLCPDIIHTHGDRTDVLHHATARKLRARVVSTIHGFSRAGFKGAIAQWIHLRALRRFDALIAVSGPLAGELVARGFDRRSVFTLPNALVGVEALLSRDRARERLRLPATAIIVGWVGRLSQEKGPDLAVEAFSRISRRDVHLAIVGDGPMMQACQDLCRRLGLGHRVTFVGAVQDAGSHLCAFDVLLLSSRSEGTPMVLLEAGMASIPAVATKVGGVPELLAGDAGFLVESDPGAIAEGLDAALVDLNTAAQRASRLREKSSGGGNQWIEEHIRLYSSLMADGRRSRIP